MKTDLAHTILDLANLQTCTIPFSGGHAQFFKRSSLGLLHVLKLM